MADFNFTLLPGEAFTAIGDFANKLLDKVDSKVGFVFVPRGKRKDFEDAVAYLVNEIKNNEDMPVLTKAALISNARKTLKGYVNQSDILEIALENLTEKSTGSEIEDDWLVHFFEKARLIENEEVKMIFGKLLAEEYNNENAISRALVDTLSIMDRKSADAFKRLCRHIVYVDENNGGKEELIVASLMEFNEFNTCVDFDEIMDLSSLGLIEYEGVSEYTYSENTATIRYGDTSYKVDSNEEIPFGQVNLTRKGRELIRVIIPERDEKCFDGIKKYFQSKHIELIEIK